MESVEEKNEFNDKEWLRKYFKTMSKRKNKEIKKKKKLDIIWSSE